MQLCMCGCGVPVRGIWSKGHCNRKPKKPTSNCGCGCGAETAPGRRYLSGHNSKSETFKQDKRRMFEELWKSGAFHDRRVWNEGLTVETSPKLAEVGKKISDSMTLEKRLQISRTLKAKNHVPPHKIGSDHPNWKGGITNIHAIVGPKLYENWKKPILVRDQFKCQRCSTHEELHVHHDKETFSEIASKFLISRRDNYSWEEKTEISDKIVEYHLKNGVSGLTLCKKCHRKEHSKHQSEDANI